MSDASHDGHGVGEGKPPQRPRSARDLTPAEIDELIADNFTAVLSTVGDGQPYAVPIIYGYRSGCFYAVLSPGRKVRNIEANPNVCVTVVQTWDMAKRWRSAVATGLASWVEDERQLADALEAIRQQYPGAPARSAGGVASLHGFLVLRVTVEQLSGRGHD